jgi:hypothetical protein
MKGTILGVEILCVSKNPIFYVASCLLCFNYNYGGDMSLTCASFSELQHIATRRLYYSVFSCYTRNISAPLCSFAVRMKYVVLRLYSGAQLRGTDL